MTWVRVDDQLADHVKILKAGPLALALQVRALCWANRQLSDGFIPTHVLMLLLHDFEQWDQATAWAEWPGKMVEAGLWEVATEGYQIHDYLDWNRSRAQILAERKAKAEAGQRGGRTTSANRQHITKNGSRPRPAKLSDTDWLAQLKADPTYAGLDIDREFGKCRQWCVTNHAVFSQKRALNWFNRVERPLQPEAPKGPYAWTCKDCGQTHSAPSKTHPDYHRCLTPP